MSLVPLPSQSGKDLRQRKEKTQKIYKKKQCCWFLPPSHPTHIPPIPTLPSAYRASTTILISIANPCSHFPYPYSYFYFPYPCSHFQHLKSFSQPSICIQRATILLLILITPYHHLLVSILALISISSSSLVLML